jgi:tRNA (adenine22-N1)-methyltransferase
MSLKLSKRLQTIADKVPVGAVLADIGSDHALLPTYLIQQGKLRFAIAGEVNPGPLDAALRQVREANISQQIHVRMGDGLTVLEAGEADAITIAGMGGNLITSILSAGKDKLNGVRKLILQPNVGEESVRSWLYANSWFLSEEDIMEEDGKIYEILCAVPMDDAVEHRMLYSPRFLECGLEVSSDRLFAMGPYLLNNAAPEFLSKWAEEIDKLERIRSQLAGSQADASLTKREEMRKQIEEIREVLQCLQRDKP